MKRRTFLGGLLAAATVGVASQYIPLRERKKESDEAWPQQTTVKIPQDGEWHHVMVFMDRSKSPETFLNGEPYTTQWQRWRYWFKRRLEGIKRPMPGPSVHLEPTPGFTTGGYFKAPEGPCVFQSDEVVVNMKVSPDDREPGQWSAMFKRKWGNLLNDGNQVEPVSKRGIIRVEDA